MTWVDDRHTACGQDAADHWWNPETRRLECTAPDERNS